MPNENKTLQLRRSNDCRDYFCRKKTTKKMVIVANKQGETDGSIFNFLQNVSSPIPIVLISKSANFVFNEDLLSLKDYVLVDVVELGWNEHRCHIFGVNTEYFGAQFNNSEWGKFDEFIKGNRPQIYFSRELSKDFANAKVLPIEYPAWYRTAKIDTEDEFNSRQIEVFFNWGLSHPSRAKLHGDIWNKSQDFGYSVCDNFMQLNKFFSEEKTERKWASINTPHYARIPMESVLAVNGVSKLSVSLWGAGKKCFRNTEASVNSIVVLPEDSLAWSFDWVHGENCIRLNHSSDYVSQLNAALKRKDLYQIYLAGIATNEKYRVDNYANYISEKIKSF